MLTETKKNDSGQHAKQAIQIKHFDVELLFLSYQLIKDTCKSGQDRVLKTLFIVLSIIIIKCYKPKDTPRGKMEQEYNMQYAMHYSCLKNEFQASRMAQQVEVPPARPDNLCSIPT